MNRGLRPWLAAAALSVLALAVVELVGGQKHEELTDLGAWRSASGPEHIVAASVFSAEVLLELVPPTRLAGVHYLAADARYSMAARAAQAVPLVGGEPEQLLAVRPDLVITDEFTKAETQQLLERAGVVVRRTHPVGSLDDVTANILALGRLLRSEPEAGRLCGRMQARIDALAKAAAAVQGWRVMTLNGALDTYGKGSLVDAVIAATGATNVAAEHGVGPYRKLDVECVLAWRPDALILAVEPGAKAEAPAWLRQTTGFDLLPCVQKQRFVFVPSALLGSTSHHVVGAAELIQAQLQKWGRP